MQQQTSLHIATSCHEDWNAMMPAGKGKFCASCHKQVVDFTQMNDTQILQFLAQQKGSLCGRFDADQLARPLAETTLSKKRSWHLALLLPVSLFFQKSFAQTSQPTTGQPVVETESKIAGTTSIRMGKFLPPTLPFITLHGSVRDDKGNAVAYASVMQKGTGNGCVSDSVGRFSLQLLPESDSMVLVADCIGYAPVEKKVRSEEANNAINLTFTTEEATLKNVTVVGYGTERRMDRMGGLSVCRSVTLTEKTDSLVKKMLRLHTFTVYPNPARNGSRIRITVKKKGDYELQLLSNRSFLLKTIEMPVPGDNTTVPFPLPTNLAAGVYYLRLLDVNSKNSYVEKILVN